ncbi:MAG: NAD(P)H-hydrate dehydratase [Gammaproteobacteria bacterium]|nr:NAD(P)H-hydrate dehydratase [Gammaproteobacteria bacterium]
MASLPQALYTVEQARALDRIAIQDFGIPEIVLMERAGRAAFAHLHTRWPQAERIVVVCGPGNNGGDGYIVACAALEAGYRVAVVTLSPPTGASSKTALAALDPAVVMPAESFDAMLVGADVIVDAVFGIGLKREIAGRWQHYVDAINAAGVPIVAIDIPSGLDSDSGAVHGVAVRATLTVTFIGLKLGLLTGAGREHVGEVACADLGLPESVYEQVDVAAKRITTSHVQTNRPMRSRAAHKGRSGHVVIIGGNHSMLGAARMAGEAAYRSGAGLVTVATRPEHAALLSAARPELMSKAAQDASDLDDILERATVVAIGPGLGRDDWAQQLWRRALERGGPMVVDADALNALAQGPFQRDDWVLTPHPGEAARLLSSTPAAVQSDRLAALEALLRRYGGVGILKGSGTLIGSADDMPALCDRGNPGMASGGMGDVLTGVIAGLIAQGLQLRIAAELGVWLHASAADIAARNGGEMGMMAMDLLLPIRALINNPNLT